MERKTLRKLEKRLIRKKMGMVIRKIKSLAMSVRKLVILEPTTSPIEKVEEEVIYEGNKSHMR